ncbi:MAG: nitrous oxide reductase accessory protein NosL [Bacteroidetes bacterium]|nr:nitrous oxide reductase accessory protein NosL [Bacteroidota bacterium]
MNKVFCLACALILFSCSANPEALNFGKDTCHFCKMTLMDNKFGAELVTKKGKVFKFDDVRCFLDFYNAADNTITEYEHILVVDFSKPGNLIDARNAFYLKSGQIQSPMNGQVAAFETKTEMTNHQKQWQAMYLTWGEAVTQFK